MIGLHPHRVANGKNRTGTVLILPVVFLLLLSGCAPAPEATLSETAVAGGLAPVPASATASAVSTAVPAVSPTDTPAPARPTPIPTITPRERPASAPVAAGEETGALIGLTMRSQVGLLLDDYPDGMRDRIAAEALAQSEEEWQARAERQLRLLKLRLNFRNFFQEGKGQLPLPPRALWDIELDPAGPSRQLIQGHDVVAWPYKFTSTLLTDATSPAQVEPALASVGGKWDEAFILPVDPDMLLQRTGNACVNEGGFPPNSYDSENIFHFYDFACTADSVGAAGCHRTVRPQLSCLEALRATTGFVETAVRFERLPWNSVLADQVRIGPLTAVDAPDLLVVGEDLNVNRIVYRFFETDACAIEEGAIGGSGWRRLLQFDATLQNVGGVPLHVGPVVSEDTEHHVFEYNACHDHFHYSNYGAFQLRDRDDVSASKQAFCVQSTSRYSNHERSPLRHNYSCSFQGIQAGWVDEYAAGLDVQWVDITDMEVPAGGLTVQLGFVSNQDRFLCEGTPVLGADGNPLWETTNQVTGDGHVVERPQCDFITQWDANNYDERDVVVPQLGSFVTAGCTKGEAGPYRNCGFSALAEAALSSCAPGEPVNVGIQLPAGSEPQLLRVCERSAVLGVGVACTYSDAVANLILEPGNNDVTFSCPAVRDSRDDRGGYALYGAAVWPGDEAVLQPLVIAR